MNTTIELPSGIVRDPNCPPSVTLDNCRSISFYFKTDDQTSLQVVISRGSTIDFRPITKSRVRDLRVGDRVLLKGVVRTIDCVEIYR